MKKPLRMKILDLGEITCKRKELIQTDSEEAMIISPMEAVLIEHPEAGYILFDTGNSPDWADTYPASVKELYPISRFVSIEEALRKEGLTTNDISTVIVSHLHFDHAGGLRYFAGTKAGANVVVSEAEWKDVNEKIPAAENGTTGAYIGKLFYRIPGIGFKPVSGEYKPAEGVTLFVQSCHTAGLIGMVVTLKDRKVLFTGDTVYLKDAYEKELPPGGAINKTNEEFYRNLKVLKEMQQALDAEVFYGHDYEQARSWRELGWIE